MLPKILPVYRLGAAAAAALLIVPAWSQTIQQLHRNLDLNYTPPESTQAKSILAGGNSKIDPSLRVLVQDAQAKSLGELGFEAKAMQIPVDDGRIAVVAAAESEASVGALSRRIQDEGGEVVAVVDEAILARVPADAVSKLGADRNLQYLAPQAFVNLPPSEVSQRAGGATETAAGVLMTKAHLLHQRKIFGAGVKVGILDFGFTRYQALQQAGLLPAPAAVKAFGKDGGWDRINTGTEHGTACAEIIHAMAPQASIYIAAIGDGKGGASSDEIIRAAMWLAEQKVDIISFSGGGHGGPHNGTDLLDKLVEEVVSKGILWVNAAGNEGDSHWSTTTRLNQDRLVMAGDKPFVLFQAASNMIAVQVSWDDWGPNPLAPTASEDYDAYLTLVDQNSGTAKLVHQSQNPQNGRGAPREIVYAQAQRGQIFALFIKGARVSRPVRMHVHVLSLARLAPATPVGSIGIPATSKMALSVGAVNVKDGKLETFSSQGPTDDDRAKPEVSAPDRTVSQAYKGEFPGTSAACPHVAGFAALVKEMKRSGAPSDLARIIEQATTPIADNRGAGRGMIDGSKLAGGGGGGAVDTPTGGGGTAGGGGNADRNPPAFSVRTARKFDSLLERASEDNAVGVKIVVGRPRYKIGDGLKIGFRARENCNCILLHRSSGGEYTPLEARLRLEAGERYSYPEGAGSNIKITGPAGRDEVALVCSMGSLSVDRIDDADADDLSISVARYQVVEE